MRRILSLLLLGFFLVLLCPGLSADRWEARNEIPYSVYGHGAAALDGKLFVLGGCETADWTSTTSRVQIYEVSTDQWSEGKPLPVALGWPMVSVYKGKIYVFGGMLPGAVSTDQAWSYDPVQDVWSALAPLPARIMNGVAISAGDAVYVGLGYERTDGTAKGVVRNFIEFYRYDPDRNAYRRLADAPEGACYAAVGRFENNIYVVHGATFEIGFHDMKDYGWAAGALKYQPDTDTWTKISAPRIEPRIFFLTQCTSSAFQREKLFIAGGQSHYRRTTTASYFDMHREIFVRIAPLPAPRCCGGGAIVDGRLTLAGGFWGVGETGDPARPTWVFAVDDRPAPGEVISNSVGMKLAYVPAGSFEMGSAWEDPRRQYDEYPHVVRLTRPFRIGVHEVTQGQWKSVMGEVRSHFQGDDLPVDSVSWSDAAAFCERLSEKEGRIYRLPTEAEWEYACRAGGPAAVQENQRLEEMAWYDRNSGETTHPVGSRRPNGWGLYDMLGNLSEWCLDRYVADYPREESADPRGPSKGTLRVIRGGSWTSFPGSCRCAARNSSPPSYQLKETGFRVVLEED
jgi:formylglycine-generating enzyme required for sulfatase activity